MKMTSRKKISSTPVLHCRLAAYCFLEGLNGGRLDGSGNLADLFPHKVSSSNDLFDCIQTAGKHNID